MPSIKIKPVDSASSLTKEDNKNADGNMEQHSREKSHAFDQPSPTGASSFDDANRSPATSTDDSAVAKAQEEKVPKKRSSPAREGKGTDWNSSSKRDALSNSDHAIDWEARRQRQKESERRRRRHRSRSADLDVPPMATADIPPRSPHRGANTHEKLTIDMNGVLSPNSYRTSPQQMGGVYGQPHHGPRSLPTSPMVAINSPYQAHHPQYAPQNPVVSPAGNPLIPILHEPAPLAGLTDTMPLLSSKGTERRHSHSGGVDHQRKRKTDRTSYGSTDHVSPGYAHPPRTPGRERLSSDPISPMDFPPTGQYNNHMDIQSPMHRLAQMQQQHDQHYASPHRGRHASSHRRCNSHDAAPFLAHNQVPTLPFSPGSDQEVLSPTNGAGAGGLTMQSPRDLYQNHQFHPTSLRNIHSPGGPLLGSEPRASRHRRSLSDNSGRLFFSPPGVAAASQRPPLTPTSAGAPVLSGHLSNGRGVYSAPDGGPMPYNFANESEPFLPKNFGDWVESRGSQRQGSSRKMNMRHKSVELFMKNVRGTEQPKKCRDMIFALLFFAQLAAVIFIGVKYGADAVIPAQDNVDAQVFMSSETEVDARGSEDMLKTDSQDSDTNLIDAAVSEVLDSLSYQNVVKVAVACGAFSVTLSALALVVMIMISRRLVQVALVFSIGLSFTWGTVGIGLNPKSFVPITGIIALALSIGYAFVVWERIPFAASNLTTALRGIRDNPVTVFMAFFFQALALVWSVFFTFVVIGVYDALQVSHLNSHLCILIYVGLGISYYWTYQVILHIVSVTTAGAIGSWWFKPESDNDRSCCSEPVQKAFFRSTFYSLGSVCLGSLLVGFVQVLRQISENFRPNRDGTVLMCLHECLVCAQECIVGCVDKMSDSFNPWAFTYVGLYGYGFMEAGHNAMDLFKTRGWTKIITDDLIPNVLFLVSIIIGGVTGFFGQLVQENDSFNFNDAHKPAVTSFLIGLCVGLVVSSVLLIIISSSTSAVIVCFAGSPVEFQNNHTELSNEMREAWREVWPGCMDVTDMKISMAIVSAEDNV